MLWILAIIAVFALTKKTTAPPSGEGPRPLESVAAYKVGPYTVIVGQNELGTWDWRVWTSTVLEGEDDADGLEEAQGFDFETEAAAKAEAMQWVAAQMKPGPGLGVATEPGTVRNGLRASPDCSSISVVDIEQWLAYATPIVRAYDVEEPTGAEALSLTVGGLFPACAEAMPKIRGKTWEQTAARVDAIIAKIRAGELLSVEEPEEAVAARLVNMSAPKVPGARALWHNGWNGRKHSIVLLPGEQPDQWRWFVWEGPRGNFSDAWRRGGATSSGHALIMAKEAADAPKHATVGVS